VPGWSVETDNVVEFWRNNFNSVRAQDGNQHIELNANNPSNVFLDVCLLQNENVTLTFHHRARPNGTLGAATIDVMEVLATNLVSGTVAVSNITATNVPDAIGTTWTGVGTVSDIAANSFRINSPTQGWTRYTATLTNNGASGTVRVRFRGIGGGSFGNFIDNVQIAGLVPLVEFGSATYSDEEADGANMPRLFVNGRVPAPGASVNISIAGGTAVAGTDYTLSGTVTVNIPAGDYNGTLATAIPIPSLGIINNTIIQPNRTINVALVAGSEAGSILINNASCNGTPILNTVYTIIDDDFILPVTFSEWFLQPVSCGHVVLRWATVEEKASNHFVVESSNDAIRWEQIGVVPAKGNSRSVKQYSFSHQSDIPQLYYRLKQVDQDGTYTYTKKIHNTADCSERKPPVRVFPNPVGSNQPVEIQFFSESEDAEYRIFDTIGRCIYVGNFSNCSINQMVIKQLQLPLALSKGTYTIVLSQQQHIAYQQLLIY
jgi:hypothetical protein